MKRLLFVALWVIPGLPILDLFLVDVLGNTVTPADGESASSQAASFQWTWIGPDTLYADENCKAYLYWTNPTPENSVRAVSLIGAGPVEVTLVSITSPYQLRDSVPAGISVRFRYRLRDQQGNEVLVNKSIPIVDRIAPVFDPVASPPSITVDCIYELSTPTVVVTDNCSDSVSLSFTQGMPPAACAGGVFQRTWIATDESGNSSQLVQTITVRPDTIAPVFTVLPVDTTTDCGKPHGREYLNWLYGQLARVRASDQGCGVANIAVQAPDSSEIAGSCGPQDIIFTVTDSCGNVNTASASFTIRDIFAPTITSTPRDTTVTCNGANASGALQDWISRRGRATATDNCGTISWSTIPEVPTLEDLCNDTLNVVFVVQDACGNRSSRGALFIIRDNTPPYFINPPADLAIACDTARNIPGRFAEWVAQGGYAIADDHCNEISYFAAIPGSYDLADQGTWPGRVPDYATDLICGSPSSPGQSYIDVDFVFYDACGNPVVQARRFSVLDDEAPVITDCPADVTAAADPATCNARIPLTPPEASESCFSKAQQLNFSWSASIVSSIPGDVTAPVDTVVLNIPVNRTFNPGSIRNVSLRLDFFQLDANQPDEYFQIYDEDGALIGRTSIQAVECANFNETLTMINGDDLERWAADQLVTFTLVPFIPQGVPTRFAINDQCGGSLVNGLLRFSAGVAGDVFYDISVDGGPFMPINPTAPGSMDFSTGDHRVVYRVYDCHGNSDSCVAMVSVFDQTGPMISCPQDATLSTDEGVCTLTQSVPLPFGLVDNCSGLERLSVQVVGATNIPERAIARPYRPQVLSFARGTSTVIYSARDSSGNQNTCVFRYTVEDREAPEAVCQSIAISLDPTGLNEYILDPAEIDGGSMDNCGITSYEISQERFDCSQAGEEIPVTLTVRDEAGNESSCTAIIRVLVPVLNPTYTVDICGNDTLKLFANTPQGMGSDPFTYLWTGPGGFTSNQRNPFRTGANATYSGTYRVIATGFNGCVSEGIVEVSINNFNTPSITSDKQRYCSNEEILLTATSYAGNVTYEWYEGIPPNGTLIGTSTTPYLTITATPGRHRYYVIVRGMNCATNPSAIYQVDVDQALIAEVDASFIEVCEGERIILGSPTVGVNYTYRWTGPDGFTSDKQYPAAIEPADPNKHNGTYMLVISNGSCSSLPVMVEVSVTRKPARPRIEINRLPCEGDTITLFVPNIGQGDRYIWTNPDGTEIAQFNDNTLTIRALRSNEGNWTVRVEIDGCESAESAPFELIIEEKLNFLAINDGPVCEGDSVTLSAELVSGASYRWTGPGNFRSTMRQVRTRAISGIYTIELTTPNGCVSSADTRVETRPVPRITALSSTGDSTCVTGVECISLTPTVFPVDMGQYTYRWTGPNGYTATGASPCVPNATERINGVYNLVVTNGECESNMVSTTVRVFNQPGKAELSGNTVYCVGDTLFLNALVSNPSTSWRYRWKTPGREYLTLDPTLKIDGVSAANDGFYSLVIENGPCQSATSDSMRINVSEQPDRPLVLALPEVCEGDSIRLKAISNEAYTYFWFGPGTFRSSEKEPLIYPVTTANAGNYSLRVEAGSCRSPLSVPVTLRVNERPSVAIPQLSTDRLCLDDPEAELEICAETGSLTDTADYRVILIPSGAVIGQLENGCVRIATSDLAAGVNRIGILGDNRGCLSDTSSLLEITGDRIPADRANAGPDLGICDPATILTAAIPAQASGVWTSPDPGVIITDPNSPGTEVAIQNEGEFIFIWTLSYESCTDYSSDTVIVFRDTAAITRTDSVLLNPGEIAELDILLNDRVPSKYSLDLVQMPSHGTVSLDASGELIYEPNDPHPGADTLVYVLCPLDCPDLCDEALVIIKYTGGSTCQVPTIITPNGDDYNDRLIIGCISRGTLQNNTLSVFNVWGDEVFRASPYQNDWEGTYNGEPLPEGSYYYVFDPGDGSAGSSGFIIIKR